jgi:two-component system, sensor histidine kinase RpfC
VIPTGPRAALRRVWARLRAREDSEHEQALVRIAVAFVMYLYLLAIPHAPEDHELIVRWVTVIFAADLVAAVGILAHIVRHPAVNPRRRLFAIFIDTLAPTSTMLVGGPSASALYPMLLWVILGHGFRYGRPYLWAAAGLALVMFGTVVIVSPEWREIPALAGALVASLVILPIYFAVLLRKLTNAIARAEEASRAKSHFLAAMSHELRTPLNAIIGMSELLGTTRLDVEQRDMTATVRTAATSLLGLVDQVLDLAKIEERRFTIEVEPFDLHDSLVRLRLLLGHLAAAKGLALKLRLAPGTPWRLRGGPRQLHQALVNLVGNAIKFTDRGRVVIRVEPTRREESTVWLRLAVEDTGIGLSAEAQASVFERFVRSDESVRRGISGSGLGLNITRELAELMGGRVGMTSALGQGSTFWLELPFALEDGSGGAEAEALGGRVVVLGGRDSAAALADRVQRFGCEARCVATAESAAELLRHHADDARQVVLVTGRSPPVDVAALAALLGATLPVEPVDLIAVGLEPRAGAAAALTLADLPADVGDAELFACLRAALRRLPPGDAAAGRAPLGTTAAGEPARSLHILVAEDNRTNQKVIGKILEHAGHRATIVATGQEAVEALEEPGFDLVLMDLNMPELGGIEAVKLLRFTHDVDALPPIVALSADATPQTREACRTVGFSAYLTKPVNTQLLLRTLAELAGGAAPARTAAAPPQPREEAPAEPSRPAVDPARLASLAELDSGDGFLDGLIDDFLADLDGILDQLEHAAVAADARTFRDQAHALRSSAAHVGALGLFDLCLSWRELDDHALLMRVGAELARLRAEAERVHAALVGFREEWRLRTVRPRPSGG